MIVARFLADLFESGRVSIAPAPPPELDQEVDAVLVSAERMIASNLAGDAPPFCLPSARWAARLFYGASQFVVCRDADASLIQTSLREPCPAPHSPQTDYSVDLVFQFLPDIIGMTRAMASGDPLLQALLNLGREWPLSSVGIPEVVAVDVKGFIGHRALRQLYADRIVARADITRLGDPLVDATVRQGLGAFPELCEPVARQWQKSGQGFHPELAA